MYFKKLELIGFKSFCEKTTLHFEPGITAVVGPNGCGKSNIFDSIRWVLGEQSIKELRGSQSQDVIFNGTDTKEPLGMAEVTLVFDNANNFFPVDHNEVAITRRIFRSGESEYLLNKAQVRLRDILDILLGTGIGAESYSLVQQGKIDLVLSSKPEDRRLVFDEASGITKYKAQKRETLRKLEETEQNLLRVNDIITEVKRQIGSLERQANKARRYKEVFEDLKSKEVTSGLLEKNKIRALTENIVNKLKELELKESGLLNSITEYESKISNRQNELRTMQDSIVCVRNEIASLESSVSQSNQRISFNKERIIELNERKSYLEEQISQAKSRLSSEEANLKIFKDEFESLEKNIHDKNSEIENLELTLNELNSKIKNSLERISRTKRNILELASKISAAKNKVSEFSAKQQIQLARKKRLDIERAKIAEEKALIEENLNNICKEVQLLEDESYRLNQNLDESRLKFQNEKEGLDIILRDIESTEKQMLSLNSHKEFLSKLKNEYDEIGESMNASIYLDKAPAEGISGLIVKVKNNLDGRLASIENQENSFKLTGEAKPIDLSTERISQKIEELQHKLESLKVIQNVKESHIQELDQEVQSFFENIRKQEIVLIDKKSSQKNIQEQFDKVKSEEEIILMEISDTDNELKSLEVDIESAKSELFNFENEQKDKEELIHSEQENITVSSQHKEDTLIYIAQARAQKESLEKKINTDKETLKILEETFNQNRSSLEHQENQTREIIVKNSALEEEAKKLESEILSSGAIIQEKTKVLREKEEELERKIADSSDVLQHIDAQKKELDEIKTSLHDLQMQNKELDFKYLSLKERLLQAYKIDLESPIEYPQENIDETLFISQIQALKDKLESYGTVNLVAIEEYDELKKRYDFLIQQQNDLNTAKESLHSAISKINRTTKQMFLETFEKVRVEFRNYFRLLFNGGDAQVFLVDEHDPLESGIEIICRPPGKKLQNVLLLSGGEKSMSAIALIFAIFKVKPAPFCVLDEIDAALDEANVDRFGRMLHEFAKGSQFIVITHNKKTIANADIMYGITMQESGVSKIVSVKFSKNKEPQKEEAVAEPV